MVKTAGAAVLAAMVLALETAGSGTRASGACWHRGTTSVAATGPRRVTRGVTTP